MGAAWRNPKERDMPYVTEMVKEVKKIGMETCMTLGMLTRDQALALKQAGLDYYNHNLDTSPEFYGDIITTRTYQDRLDTLDNVRGAGMNVCSGGIVGMGETASDRSSLLMQLANLEHHPESVPINMLVKVKGTPMENVEDLDYFEFIRTIAIARIMMPKSYVRLSAGREAMNEQMQAMCFMAGANSIFYGCKLLTTSNPETHEDVMLFKKLGINSAQTRDYSDEAHEAALLEEIEDKSTENLFYDASNKQAETVTN
jgi:biotin synthase